MRQLLIVLLTHSLGLVRLHSTQLAELFGQGSLAVAKEFWCERPASGILGRSHHPGLGLLSFTSRSLGDLRGEYPRRSTLLPKLTADAILSLLHASPTVNHIS